MTSPIYELPIASYEGRLYNDGFDPHWRGQVMPYKAVVCLDKELIEKLKRDGLEAGSALSMHVWDTANDDRSTNITTYFEEVIRFDDILKFLDTNLQRYEDFHVYWEGLTLEVDADGSRTYHLTTGS